MSVVKRRPGAANARAQNQTHADTAQGSATPEPGKALSADRAAAERFLNALDPFGTGQFTFQTFDDDQDRKLSKLARVLHGTLDQHWDTLQRLNQQGAGVYVTVGATDGKGRKAENITHIRSLFTDMDGAPLDPVLTWKPPHIVIESSPRRWHCYWLVEGMQLADFRAAQKGLIARFNSDPSVHDLPRVMRLPGFWHQKTKGGSPVRPHLVRIDRIRDAAPYAAAEFMPAGAQSTADAKPTGPAQAKHARANDNEPPEWLKARMKGDTGRGLSSDPTDLPAPPDLDTINAALAVISSDDYEVWFKIGCALRAELGDKGFIPFFNWSKKSENFKDHQDCRAKWDQCGKVSKIRAGTIFYYADEADPDWRDHIEPQQKAKAGAVPAADAFTATAYAVPDENTLPSWDWLYGKHLLRGTVSGTVAAGGTGKSTKAIVEALAITTGKPLLGVPVPKPCRVLLINLEDNRLAMHKRIVAAMKHYGLTQADLGERLFVIAKGETKIKIAGMMKRVRGLAFERDDDIIASLIDFITKNNIDVVSVDPFVKTHGVSENDNVLIQAVVECYDDIAEQARCAIHLWHHTRKQGDGAISVESARGAIAFVDACRSVSVLETMTKAEGDKLKVEGHASLYLKEYNGKRNFAPPPDQATWYRFINVALNGGFGDDVGVITPWQPPSARKVELTLALVEQIKREVAAGEWRESIQAEMWVGKAVAKVLGLDADADKLMVKNIVSQFLKNGVLKTVPGRDAKREPRMFVVCGDGAGRPTPAGGAPGGERASGE
jgi:hypothetical protein